MWQLWAAGQVYIVLLVYVWAMHMCFYYTLCSFSNTFPSIQLNILTKGMRNIFLIVILIRYVNIVLTQCLKWEFKVIVHLMAILYQKWVSNIVYMHIAVQLGPIKQFFEWICTLVCGRDVPGQFIECLTIIIMHNVSTFVHIARFCQPH